MTATDKASPRVRVNNVAQRDRLSPIVFSPIFISSLTEADRGPESAFSQSLSFLPLYSSSAAGKRQTVANLKPLSETSPRWQSADATRKLSHLESPLLAHCTWVESTREAILLC